MPQFQTSNGLAGSSYQAAGSSMTVRHAVSFGDTQNIHNNSRNSEDVLGSVTAIAAQLDALMDNQRSNHHTLVALIDQPMPQTSDIGEVIERVGAIEGYIESLVDLREAQESSRSIYRSGPSPNPEPSRPEPSLFDAVGLSIHDEPGSEPPADPRIDSGTSNEPTQTLTQIFDEIMLSTSSIPAPPIQPPPLVHFIHNPVLSAGRSSSPIVVDPRTTARPPAAPRYPEIPPPVVRPPRPRQTPQRTLRPHPRPRPHRTQPPLTQVRTPSSETERAVRALRMERLAKVDQTFDTDAVPPPHQADPGPSTTRAARTQLRQASRTEAPGPPAVGPRANRYQTQSKHMSALYGRPPLVGPQRAQMAAHRTEHQRENHNTSAPAGARDRHAHRPANEPPTFMSSSWYNLPQQPPPRPSPWTVQFPPPEITNNMLEILRETRRAQLTTIDQQREVMRYMRDFNGWLSRQVQERQSGYEEVSLRIDQMRDEVGRLRRRGERE